MLGIIVYVYFLVLGYLYVRRIFAGREFSFQLWSGGIFGNLLLMFGIVPLAFVFRFTYISHILLMVLSAAPYIILTIKDKKKPAAPEPVAAGKKKHKAAALQKKRSFQWEGEAVNRYVLLCLVPLLLITCVLLINHIMTPGENGAITSGQSTYGDLAIHMGFVTSFAEQGTFPPEYNQLVGAKLGYPFLIDSLSSSLYLFGTPLRWAILIPSFVFSALLILGFYMLAYKLTKRRGIAVLACVLFFVGGGFGFAYFFEGAKSDPTQFTRIFTEYYKTPTNHIDENIRWVNPICDMIVPQRTTMAGWTVVLYALWILDEAVKSKKRMLFILVGVIAGCMPMIHTHSLMALGVISAVLFFCYLYGEQDKKTYLIHWIIYGAIACVMILPQVFYWTFGQVSGGNFLKWGYNWVNKDDPYLWFWLKNLGITALFIVPAFLNTSKENKKLFGAAIPVFILADLILFQPNEYDNNKLFFVVYMLAVILVSEYLVFLFDKLKGTKGRYYLAVLVIVSGVLSGSLTMIREYKSGGEYQTFSRADLEFGEFVKEYTDPHAVFATGKQHLNPVTVLAGRSAYAGASLFMYSHGFGPLYESRSKEITSLYESTSQQQITQTAEKCGIRYIMITPSERKDYKISDTAFAGLKKVYDTGGITLYDME